jgi:hypothetical protein
MAVRQNLWQRQSKIGVSKIMILNLQFARRNATERTSSSTITHIETRDGYLLPPVGLPL